MRGGRDSILVMEVWLGCSEERFISQSIGVSIPSIFFSFPSCKEFAPFSLVISVSVASFFDH